MDTRHGKIRMNGEGDRFSNLPDGLIHKILSFISTKQAVETSALSSRWRYIWTLMPSLSFPSEEFKTVCEFSKFVTHVLSRRNDQIEVSSVKLAFRGIPCQDILEQILNYAFSHNIEQLNIAHVYGMMIFPNSIFSSRSLKHLTLDVHQHSKVTPSTWKLPALETLNLYHITLYEDGSHKGAGLFSNLANLKNLTFKECKLDSSNNFNICHPGLSSLTLDTCSCFSVNVATPQLKNFIVYSCRRIHLISAPNLSFLNYKDYGYLYDEDDYYGTKYGWDCDYDYNYDAYPDVDPLQLSTQPSCLEKVDIRIDHPFDDPTYKHNLFNLLQQLHSVKFLNLNLELVKFISSFVEPSPFTNLKSLKVYPDTVTAEEKLQPKVTTDMSHEVKNYFLDSSPGATLTIVSPKDIRALKNVTLARGLIKKLQVLIKEFKENSETNMARQEKTPIYKQEKDTIMEWHCGERVTRIKSYWADLNKQLEIGRKTTDRTISILRRFQTALKRMPATYKAKLRAEFISLSLEADTMMDNMMDQMKMQCDEKPNRSQTSSFMNLQLHPKTGLLD